MREIMKTGGRRCFRHFKQAVIAGGVLILLAVSIFYMNQTVLQTGSQYIMAPDKVPAGDAVLILGAYVFPDGTVSQMLEERLKVGYELYQTGKAGKIIVSGDHSRKDYDEVNAMKKFYTDRNIPAENVFMDHAGFTTYESMYRAKFIFKSDRLIVVTQSFHLPRAIFLARELGIEAYGVEAEDGNYGQSVMLTNKARETVARCKAWIAAAVKPQPTFMGEEIPVSGNGRLTDDKEK